MIQYLVPEIYYLLEGILAYEEGNHKVQLGPQDYLVTSDLESKFILSALSDVEFLYVSSAPGFSEVSQRLNELMQLAVDIEIKDGYTADHCYRIQQLSYRTGLELGLDSNSLFRLDNASYLHDIGKIKVPLEILQKPDKLSMDEWRIMQQHPIFGREFLENTLIKDAAPIVEQHHERLDGSGYPYHLAGDDIMVEASIVAVADSFDAMTTDRPYRARLSREDAYAELKQGAGIVYEQEVVKAFLSAVKKISH